MKVYLVMYLYWYICMRRHTYNHLTTSIVINISFSIFNAYANVWDWEVKKAFESACSILRLKKKMVILGTKTFEM